MADLPKPKSKAVYRPPQVLWVTTLSALMMVTKPMCVPGQDPRCTP